MKPLIPLTEPWIGNMELKELKEVIDSTFLTEHEKTKEFEEKLKKFTGAKYVLAVCNGTAGLFCALKALGIGRGDEVIVPDLTFIATANAVILAGATPVFCDVNLKTFCIDPIKIEEKISQKTKAIMPVHLYGHAADMDAIMKIAKKYGLYVIEDAAQGIGVKFRNAHVGTFGEVGVLSFYGNKPITTGEGGAILTNSKTIYKKCFEIKNHGRDRKGMFIHRHIGWNFCFTDLQAAIGIAQLKKLREIIKRKKEIRDQYLELLKDINKIGFPEVDKRCSPVFWFTNILVRNPGKLARYLNLKGIQTRRFFYPLHKQPCYGFKIKNNIFPNSTWAYERGLSLPSSVLLKSGEIKYIAENIKFFVNRGESSKL